MYKIVFVCYANIQRSKYAEERMKEIIRVHNLDNISANSAGKWHIFGTKNEYDQWGTKGRKEEHRQRVKDADLILVMSKDIERDLRNIRELDISNKKIFTLKEFVFNKLLGENKDDADFDIKDGPTQGNEGWKPQIDECMDKIKENIEVFKDFIEK
ncbi:hypothetical protein J4458_03315 [Candidatus Woesearchaeota archaeon]|nr:hypothetical protein [Candidatus Woesearchaeota archaeon]